jgi:hypothetical protein
MAIHQNSLANLKKAKRFKNGNPGGGRPKLPDFDTIIAKVLSEEKDGMTAAEHILLKLRKQAESGNQRAAEYLLDRAYGKPRQQINASTDTNETLRKTIDQLFPPDEEIIASCSGQCTCKKLS